MNINKVYKSISVMGVVAILFFVSFIVNSPKASFFIGKWVYPGNDSQVTFRIHVFKKNSKIVGQHYYYRQGVGLDTSAGPDDVSLYDMVAINDHTVELTFSTGYGAGANSAKDFIGKVRLIKISSNKIKWKITKPPKAVYLVPDEVVLKKYNE